MTYIDNLCLEVGEGRLERLHARRTCDVGVDEEDVRVDVEHVSELVQHFPHQGVDLRGRELPNDVLPAVGRVWVRSDEKNPGRFL